MSQDSSCQQDLVSCLNRQCFAQSVYFPLVPDKNSFRHSKMGGKRSKAKASCAGESVGHTAKLYLETSDSLIDLQVRFPTRLYKL